MQSELQDESADDPMKAEMDLFMKEMKEIDKSPTQSSEVSSAEVEEPQKVLSDKEVNDLIGKKCQAPHTHSWGSVSYHNAFISNLDESETEASGKIMVLILFLHPINKSMIPCPFYLDGNCKYESADCRFSHGELMALKDLKDYKEPNYSLLKKKCDVLAKQDQLWSRGIVKSVDFDLKKCKVRISHKEVNCDFANVFPIEHDEDESDLTTSDSDSEIENVLVPPISFSNLFHPKNNSALGEWEQFTTGFGSKMMAKMGYTPGTGLGIRGNGIVTPVTAQIIPQGCSLDHILNLREQANGDQDLFSVERKLKKMQKKQEFLNQKNYNRDKNKKDVFSFISNIMETPTPSRNKPENPVEKFKKESTKNLNVANYQLGVDIKRTEKDIDVLKKSLKRHQPDSQIHKHITSKIAQKHIELKLFQESEKSVANEQKVRKEKNKLTIF